MRCDECSEPIHHGRIIDGAAYCTDCLASWEPVDAPYDTPSLQDSDPEGWGAAHNVNPWGMDGGY